MKLWSKGLGKLILPFYLDKAESVLPSQEYILIRGRIVEGKVNWPYKIFLFPQDMVRFISFMSQNDIVISFLKRNLGFGLVKFVILRLLKTFFIITPKVLFMKIFSRKKSEIVYDEIIAKIIGEKIQLEKEKSSEENKSDNISQNMLPDEDLKDGEDSNGTLNLVKSKAKQNIYQGGMIFWSKGLGRRSHIVIPCGEEKPEDKGEVIVLHGKTLPPVVWIYTMTMEPQDFVSILKLGLSYEFVDFLLHPKKIKFALPLLFYLILFTVKYAFMRGKFYQFYSEEDAQKDKKKAQVQQ